MLGRYYYPRRNYYPPGFLARFQAAFLSSVMLMGAYMLSIQLVFLKIALTLTKDGLIQVGIILFGCLFSLFFASFRAYKLRI
jgi:DMSO/TMAO reductase YedYZ heme-binding membrane subunit